MAAAASQSVWRKRLARRNNVWAVSASLASAGASAGCNAAVDGGRDARVASRGDEAGEGCWRCARAGSRTRVRAGTESERGMEAGGLGDGGTGTAGGGSGSAGGAGNRAGADLRGGETAGAVGGACVVPASRRASKARYPSMLAAAMAATNTGATASARSPLGDSRARNARGDNQAETLP